MKRNCGLSITPLKTRIEVPYLEASKNNNNPIQSRMNQNVQSKVNHVVYKKEEKKNEIEKEINFMAIDLEKIDDEKELDIIERNLEIAITKAENELNEMQATISNNYKIIGGDVREVINQQGMINEDCNIYENKLNNLLIELNEEKDNFKKLEIALSNLNNDISFIQEEIEKNTLFETNYNSEIEQIENQKKEFSTIIESLENEIEKSKIICNEIELKIQESLEIYKSKLLELEECNYQICFMLNRPFNILLHYRDCCNDNLSSEKPPNSLKPSNPLDSKNSFYFSSIEYNQVKLLNNDLIPDSEIQFDCVYSNQVSCFGLFNKFYLLYRQLDIILKRLFFPLRIINEHNILLAEKEIHSYEIIEGFNFIFFNLSFIFKRNSEIKQLLNNIFSSTFLHAKEYFKKLKILINPNLFENSAEREIKIYSEEDIIKIFESHCQIYDEFCSFKFIAQDMDEKYGLNKPVQINVISLNPFNNDFVVNLKKALSQYKDKINIENQCLSHFISYIAKSTYHTLFAINIDELYSIINPVNIDINDAFDCISSIRGIIKCEKMEYSKLDIF